MIKLVILVNEIICIDNMYDFQNVDVDKLLKLLNKCSSQIIF